jgi:citrate lyase subunit beta / citryl-CoA lyase
VTALTRVRSMLFMPGNRPDMIAKIPRFAPDIAVADLEDAVAADAKTRARSAAVAAIGALAEAGPANGAQRAATTVLVRVNPVGTPWFADDVAAAAGSAAAGLVVPKLESQHQVDQVRQVMAEHSWLDGLLIAGLETALGVADARTLLARGVSGVYFGAEDYAADIGGRRSRGGAEVLYARSQVLLAARLAGIPALDQVVPDLSDDEQFLADTRAGRDLGYQGKMCIHPRQVPLAHEVFTPTDAEVAHAREVLVAGRAGVGVVDGEMIDDVHVRMARTVLARAGLDVPEGEEPS